MFKGHKWTVLPKQLDRLVKTNIENEKMQKVAIGFLFATFICLLGTFFPVFAGTSLGGSVAGMFGYPDSVYGAYAEILSGRSAAKTINQCFSTEIFAEINGLALIDGIIKLATVMGIAMILLYIGLGIIEAIQQGQMTQEKLLSLMLTFLIPMLFIVNFNAIRDGLTQAGMFAKDQLENVAMDEDSQLQEWDQGKYDTEQAGKLKALFDDDSRSLLEKMDDIAAWMGAYENGMNKTYKHIMYIVYGMNQGGEDKSFFDRWGERVENSAAEALQNIVDSDNVIEGVWEAAKGAIQTGWEAITGWFGSLGDTIAEAIEKLFESITDFLLELILIAVDIGIRLGIMVSCYGLLGRYIIYQSFLPMSIADIGRDGARSNGMRMVKMYFAVFIEIGMFFLINVIGWKIFELLVMQQSNIAGLIVCYIGAGVGIRAMMKSAKSISERLVGVNG